MNFAKQQLNQKHLFIGLIVFSVSYLLLPNNLFTYEAKLAMSSLALMIYWWITRPIHIAVTALLPIALNSVFSFASMSNILANYFSQIVVLLLGANILTLAWKKTGLDKRIALKSLNLIGTNVKYQLIVWFMLSILLSSVLPNAVVVAALSPIAYSMMTYLDESSSNQSILHMILLMIVWGAGLGGFGTPLGGAMNLVAITHIENYIGREFMFIDWVLTMVPYIFLLSVGFVLYILFQKYEQSKIEGSHDYFIQSYKALGKMSKAEVVSLVLFTIPVILSFIRPLYANLLPDFKPFFAFMVFALFAFVISDDEKNLIMTWEYAQKNINWGLMILFSGGLAIGNILIETGAIESLSTIIQLLNLKNISLIIIVILILAMFLANASSNTAAVAISVPLVIGIMNSFDLNTLGFVYIAVAASNCAFLFPTSIRAISIGFGITPDYLFKKGVIGVFISFIILFTYALFVIS